MAAPGVLDRPEIEDVTDGSGEYMVIVYNNETNTFEEVIEILMIATGCDQEEAEIETWEIDRLGKSVVHYADQETCENVAEVIRIIGIEVEVRQE